MAADRVSDPPTSESLNKAVREVLESLGVLQGQEEAFLRILRISIETHHGCLEFARNGWTETGLSSAIVN
jgi:hypothetical protein